MDEDKEFPFEEKYSTANGSFEAKTFLPYKLCFRAFWSDHFLRYLNLEPQLHFPKNESFTLCLHKRMGGFGRNCMHPH